MPSIVISTANPNWPDSPVANLVRRMPVDTSEQRAQARKAMTEWGIGRTPILRGNRRPTGRYLEAL